MSPLKLRSLFFWLICLLSISVEAIAIELSYSNELKNKLEKARLSQAENYQVKTKHLCDNKPCYTNRLILENSPYLLQHAHNPIDWHAWNKETLEKAKRENKPIFLSVGYASCHWCHVMEEESFDTVEIAELLNKHFIAIKVDRERRPDIDEFYGNAMMYFVGQQGWPMSLFLTPDAKPFDGGGYFPFENFKQLIVENNNYWQTNQKEVLSDAELVMSRIKTGLKANGQAAVINDKLRTKAVKSLRSIIDNYNGGFGESSKFPREPWLALLLNDSYNKVENNDSLVALTNTLTHIGEGGIYDQLGGGFHRYATDAYWKIPHFEKMLYNQVLLMRLYLQANNIKPDDFYTDLVDQTATFLIREMQHPEGAFYSSIDADSSGEEGKFYLWDLKEWEDALGKNSELFAELYDVDDYGETYDGHNVLYLTYSADEFSKEKGLSKEKFNKKLAKAKEKLLLERNKRKQPAIDKKLIMGWNGLAISALAEASHYLNKPEYLQVAIKNAEFIWHKMQSNNPESSFFYRSQFKGKNTQYAQLDDYAYYLQALIVLYDIDRNKKWLERAETISQLMRKLFWDNEQGGYFNVANNLDAPLPVRPKSAFDKTLPSGNAVAAQSLQRLYLRTGNESYKNDATAVLSAFAGEVQETPSAFSGLLIVADEMQSGEKNLPVYAARGQLRVDAKMTQQKNNTYSLSIEIESASHWHINSNKPLEKYLIPTLVKMPEQVGWQLDSIHYPQHELINLGFSDKPLALYQGKNTIIVNLNKNKGNLNPVIHLQLQACNDSVCLPPEKLVLYPHL